MRESIIGLRAEMQERYEGLRAEIQESIKGLRAEMQERYEGLRAEFKQDLSNLEKLMDARLTALEHRLARTDFWVKFFGGLISALFIAQLTLSLIR
ncbi:MAG: hypothetical protein RMK65_13005 [Anaerolineae bacterium]|nr:hypothetical protein [Anaerolineae bacterium]